MALLQAMGCHPKLTQGREGLSLSQGLTGSITAPALGFGRLTSYLTEVFTNSFPRCPPSSPSTAFQGLEILESTIKSHP